MKSTFWNGYAVGAAVVILIRILMDCLWPDKLLVEMKAEAIKRNAAEWVVDPATGSTTFKWKEVVEKP